jgi:hypothetical protein
LFISEKVYTFAGRFVTQKDNMKKQMNNTTRTAALRAPHCSLFINPSPPVFKSQLLTAISLFWNTPETTGAAPGHSFVSHYTRSTLSKRSGSLSKVWMSPPKAWMSPPKAWMSTPKAWMSSPKAWMSSSKVWGAAPKTGIEPNLSKIVIMIYSFKILGGNNHE